jgi:heme-degrading monooxygenase HmoA
VVARIALFPGQPDRFSEERYRWVIDTIRKAPGFVAAYHVVDQKTGDAFSFSVWESMEDVQAAEDGVGEVRRALRVEPAPPDDVRYCDVIDATMA